MSNNFFKMAGGWRKILYFIISGDTLRINGLVVTHQYKATHGYIWNAFNTNGSEIVAVDD